jgi:hypothetical protein
MSLLGRLDHTIWQNLDFLGTGQGREICDRYSVHQSGRGSYGIQDAY